MVSIGAFGYDQVNKAFMLGKGFQIDVFTIKRPVTDNTRVRRIHRRRKSLATGHARPPRAGRLFRDHEEIAVRGDVEFAAHRSPTAPRLCLRNIHDDARSCAVVAPRAPQDDGVHDGGSGRPTAGCRARDRCAASRSSASPPQSTEQAAPLTRHPACVSSEGIGMNTEESGSDFSRRKFLKAIGLAGVGAVVAACSSSKKGASASASTSSAPSPTASSAATSAASTPASSGASSAVASAGRRLASQGYLRTQTGPRPSNSCGAASRRRKRRSRR